MTPTITDNKVMRGLECCINYNCFQCPYDDSLECTENLNKDIFDFINRQQTENERLRYNLEAVLNERADHTEAIKEFVNEILSPFAGKAYLSKRDLEIIVEHLAKYY